MPTYKVTNPDTGQTVRLTGDSPPTEREIEEIFASISPQPVDYEFSKTVKNLPGSLLNMGRDMVGAVVNPIDTATGLATLARQGANKAGLSLAEMISGNEAPNNMPGFETEAFDAAVDDFVEPYSSLDNFKRTAMEDPARLLLDATSVAAPMQRVPGLARVGAAIDPVNAATKTAKAVTKGVAEFIPNQVLNDWYQRAAKFTNSKGTAYQDRLAETAVREGIMPTKDGIRLMFDRIGILGEELMGMIDDAERAGKNIPIDAVFTRLQKLREDVGYLKLEGRKDLAAIDDIARDFHELAKSQGRSYFTPSELLGFKRRTQKKATYDQSQVSDRTPQVVNETRQAVAASADDALDRVAPGSAAVNDQLSDLLELAKNLDKNAGRIANHSLFGLASPINLGVGTAIGGVPGAAAATVINIIRNPKVTARTATALRKLKDGDIEWLRANKNNSAVTAALYLATYPDEISSLLETNQ